MTKQFIIRLNLLYHGYMRRSIDLQHRSFDKIGVYFRLEKHAKTVIIFCKGIDPRMDVSYMD